MIELPKHSNFGYIRWLDEIILGYKTKGAVLDHFGAGGDWRWGTQCSSWTLQDIVVLVSFLSIVRSQCARSINEHRFSACITDNLEFI